jgi:hypothetical protein
MTCDNAHLLVEKKGVVFMPAKKKAKKVGKVKKASKRKK